MSIYPNDTNFVQYSTTLSSAWAQDINNFVYRCITPGSVTGSNQLLYANGSSQMTWLPSAANAILVTDGSGTPSWQAGGLTTLGTVTVGTWHATIIEMAYGGTGANLIASNGGIVYSGASSLAILNGQATANKIVLAGSNAAPTWSPYTMPATVTANGILFSAGTTAISQITSAASSILLTDVSSVPSFSQTLPSAVQGNITTTGTVTQGTWSGSYGTTVPLNKGGTNANLTADLGAIPYSTGSAFALLAHTATANQLLMSGASAAPAWSTATYPTTTTTSQLLYSSAPNAVAGLATANSGVLVTNLTGVPSILGSTVTNTILQGSSTGAPTWSSATYPSSTTINQLLYSSANDVVGQITAAANGVLITNNTNVPSLLANGSAGAILQANSAAPPAWTTATYPTTTTNNNVLCSTAPNVVGQIATANSAWFSTNSSGVPSWSTAALPVTLGGTGLTTATTAYGVVCAGTTATGAFQVLNSLGSSLQVLTSNGAGALPTWQAASGTGSLVLISTATASSSATIDFTSLSSTYFAYEILIESALPATDNTDIWVRIGTGAGPTYQSGASAYKYAYCVTTNDGTPTNFANGSTGAAQIVIDDSVGNATSRGFNGHIRLGRPSKTVGLVGINTQLQRVDNAGNFRYTSGAGEYQTAGTAITAIRIMMSSGNMASGTFKLYGWVA